MTIITVFCVLSTFALSLQIEMPEGLSQSSEIAGIVENLKLSINTNILQSTILLIAIVWLTRSFFSKHIKNHISIIIWAAILSSFWAISVSYLQVGSVQLLYHTKGQLVKTIIYVVGMTYLLYIAISLFYNIICTDNTKIARTKPSEPKKVFFKYLTILILIWMPTIIISLPAKIYGDTWNQIAQAWNIYPRLTHHPVSATMIIYAVMRFALSVFGSITAGLVTLELLQYILSSLVIAYSLTVMDTDFHAPKWIIIFAFAVFTLSIYAESFSVLVKDVPYSIAFLLLIIETSKIIIDSKAYFSKKKNIIFLMLAVLGICIFRLNGRYLILIFSIAMFIFLCKEKISKNIVYFIIPLVAAVMINSALTKLGNFSVGPKTDLLCTPMQQVARIVTYHPEGITEDEKETISKVCDYDRMSQSYSPLIADPVKETYYKVSEINDDTVAFLKVWIQLVKRYPITAISATINQNIPLLYPFLENSRIYSDTSIYYYYYDMLLYQPVAEQLEIFDESLFENARQFQMECFDTIKKLPVLGLLSQQAIYVIIIISLIIFSVISKKKTFLLIVLPVIITLIMIAFGPCIQYMPRYAYPIVYSTPFLIAFFRKLNERNC